MNMYVGLYLLLASIVAIVVVINGLVYFFRKSTKQYGMSCMKVGTTAFFLCIGSCFILGATDPDIAAKKQGFDNSADLDAASREHFTSARLWHYEMRRRAALAETQIARARTEELARKDRYQADERAAEKRSAEAEAAAEAERAAADTAKAKLEAARQATAELKAAADAKAAEVAKAKAEEEEKAKQQASAAAQAKAEEEARKAEEEAKAQAEAAAEAEAKQKEDDELYAHSAARAVTFFKVSLKDADSAEVQGVHVVKLSDHMVALCGIVNAKNSFGAYTGFRRFVVSADLEVAQFEGPTQDANFDSAWYNYCDR